MEKQRTPKKKIALRIVIIFIAFFLVSNAIATKIIYDNIFCRYDKDALTEDVRAMYGNLVRSRESLYISDGNEDNTLKAYFYNVSNEKGLIVIAPGLHAGANHYLAMTQYFTDNGYDVLSFDPLGTIESKGKSCKGFSQEIEDLDRVLSFAEKNYAGEDLYVLGHSRGAFAACSMIGSNHDIKAIVSVAGLNSAMEAVIGLSSRYIGPVANANYFNLWLYQVMLFGADTMSIKADEKIDEGNVPILVIQGSADRTAPAAKYSIYSHKDEMNSGNVSYIYIEEEGKNDHTDILYEADGISPNAELMREIVEFFE